MEERIHEFERAVEDWHWWYRTRRDILDAILKTLPLDREHSLLLDVGCGTGGASLVLSKHGRAVGLDAAQRSFSLAMDRPYAHRVVGSAEVLPFASERFDVVAALDVLEHLDDDVGGAKEIRRVLKPGGTAIVFVPAFRILWGKNDDDAHHRRRYTRPMLRKVLEAGGLTVGPIGYFNMLLFLPLLAARLAEKVAPRRLSKLEYQERPTALNEVLARVFSVELPLLRRAPLPVGTSAFCVARRAI